MSYRGLHRVISGGQTGADQGGLLAAYRFQLETGGTAPDGFYTDVGNQPLLECLGLKAKGDYRTRTIQNVRDSDGTVLLSLDLDSPGSTLTRNEAKRARRPFIEYDITPVVTKYEELKLGTATPADLRDIARPMCEGLHNWLLENNVGVLNVAGNRERHKLCLTTYSVAFILSEVFALIPLIRKL